MGPCKSCFRSVPSLNEPLVAERDCVMRLVHFDQMQEMCVVVVVVVAIVLRELYGCVYVYATDRTILKRLTLGDATKNVNERAPVGDSASSPRSRL